MSVENANLQPLPVERAQGLDAQQDDGDRGIPTDSDPAALQLEKQSLLAGRRSTLSDGV